MAEWRADPYFSRAFSEKLRQLFISEDWNPVPPKTNQALGASDAENPNEAKIRSLRDTSLDTVTG